MYAHLHQVEASGQLHAHDHFTPCGRNSQCPLKGRLGWSQSQCRNFGQKKNLLSLPDIKITIPHLLLFCDLSPQTNWPENGLTNSLHSLHKTAVSITYVITSGAPTIKNSTNLLHDVHLSVTSQNHYMGLQKMLYQGVLLKSVSTFQFLLK